MKRAWGAKPPVDDFVARWLGILEVWRAETDLSLSRVDLQHLLTQLLLWFEGGMFQQRQPAPRVFPTRKAFAPGNAKEHKWGKYRDSVQKTWRSSRGRAGRSHTPTVLVELVEGRVWGMVWAVLRLESCSGHSDTGAAEREPSGAQGGVARIA